MRFYFIIVLACTVYSLLAQNTSAILDLESTTEGVLVPRMTSTQRMNISNPVNGLLVYDVDENTFWYYQVNQWVDLSKINQAFERIDTTVRNNGNYAKDNFLFGSPQIDNDGNVNHHSRMFFHKGKSAFRVGNPSFYPDFTDNVSAWDVDSLGEFSFAAGLLTKATGLGSVAIGSGAEALGLHSMSMLDGKAVGPYAFSLGLLSRSAGNYSVAIGYEASALDNHAFAIGYYASASGELSTAIGYENYATGYGSISLGSFTDAGGDFSAAIGSSAEAEGYEAVAIGSSSKAIGDHSVAIGDYTQSIGESSTALGSSTMAQGDYSTAMGHITTATGENATSTGSNTLAEGNASFAGGKITKASGAQSVALGNDTEAIGNNSFAMGHESIAQGERSFVMGGDSYAVGASSASFGSLNYANGDLSITMGESNIANANGTIAMGENLVANVRNGMVVGMFNDSLTVINNDALNDKDPLFIVGNGNADNDRSNALVIYKDGTLTIEHKTATPADSTGLIIKNKNSNKLWSLYTAEASGNLFLFSNASGTTSVGNFDEITGVYNATSDKRSKKNIQPMEPVLAKIERLNPVNYRYKHQSENEKLNLGFIAQEIKKIFPELVHYEADLDQYSLNYDGFGVLAIKAIQEQQEEMDSYRKRLDDQSNEIEALKELIHKHVPIDDFSK